jgi:hypothetical protein
MSRWDRLRAWYRDEPRAAPASISPASAVASLYRHWRHAGRELELLAQALTHQQFQAGLQTLERACALVRIADELVEVIERISYERDGPETAEQLRRDLLAEILPWLEAARQELPAAATVLCTLASDAASRDAALAALKQLVRAPRPWLSRQRTGS